MRRLETRLDGPVLVEPVVHGDRRGFFSETYRRSVFEELGLRAEFVQDNHSRSAHGVVRGLHYQPGMAKLVRCVRGAIFDVLVDVRRGSPSFGEWEGFRLDDENLRSLFAPEGFAHGFCVLSEEADVTYRCTAYYDPETDAGIRFDDPELGVEWPAGCAVNASERDLSAPALSEVADSLPFRFSA